MKHKLINGWTKESVKAQVRKYNNGTKSKDERTNQCVYQSTNGNRCFVGCFIPDNEIKDTGNTLIDAVGLITKYPHLEISMPLGKYSLFEFQTVHDSYDRRFDSLTLYKTLDKWIDENTEE